VDLFGQANYPTARYAFWRSGVVKMDLAPVASGLGHEVGESSASRSGKSGEIRKWPHIHCSGFDFEPWNEFVEYHRPIVNCHEASYRHTETFSGLYGIGERLNVRGIGLLACQQLSYFPRQPVGCFVRCGGSERCIHQGGAP
jgi:hypothetical protein